MVQITVNSSLCDFYMQDYEKLGSFYLGRKHDLAAGETLPEAILYDSKDLTTHAVCVGMTGSGKTGLCLSLLEEAGLDGIPAIAIDPKGDLGNLLLTFPDLEPSDFLPWIDPSVARRKELTNEQFAEQTADLWRNGLASWGQDGDRIRRYRDAVDMAIYTPGSSAGLPLTILKSFNAPPPAVIGNSDAFRDRVQASASGVLALLGIDADPVRSREHILLSNVLDRAWRAGRDLDLPALIHEIQKPPFERVGVVDLETFYPAKDRLELGMQLNNLLASPSFASWMEGEPLDVQRLLYTSEGKPRLSILSIAHLNESERMFFVTILLNEIISWMRSQPGTGSLRALLYMDEVFGYFPPTANPPSKKPMLTLLKQARAYGLGCILATQNPVDLDYKGLSNAGTWFLGRLQTERDKARVLEGLEGASAQAGSAFNRGKMEQTLAALGSRVFLMNNVHDNQPMTFHTRWAMSYLRGPLTRDQIHKLMAPRKAAMKAAKEAAAAKKKPLTESAVPGQKATSPAATPVDVSKTQPVMSASITQQFWPLEGRLTDGQRLVYRPALLGKGKLHFVRASYHIDLWRECFALQPVHGEMPDPVWETACIFDRISTLEDDPQPGAEYDGLASELARDKNYKGWKTDLKNYLYRTECYSAWRCEELKEKSQSGESEADFRIRITQLAREKRDDAKEGIRKKFEKKLARAKQRILKAQEHLSLQRSQFWTRILELVWRVLSLLLGGSSRRGMTSSGARTAMRERGEQSRAQQRLDDCQADLEELESDRQAALEQIEFGFEPKNLTLEKLELRPRKSDTVVDSVTLVWLPWKIDKDGTKQPAY